MVVVLVVLVPVWVVVCVAVDVAVPVEVVVWVTVCVAVCVAVCVVVLLQAGNIKDSSTTRASKGIIQGLIFILTPPFSNILDYWSITIDNQWIILTLK